MTSTAHIPQYQHYWSADPQGPLFGAYHSLLSIFSGFSVCHPIYHKYHDDDDDDDDDNAMAQVLRKKDFAVKGWPLASRKATRFEKQGPTIQANKKSKHRGLSSKFIRDSESPPSQSCKMENRYWGSGGLAEAPAVKKGLPVRPPVSSSGTFP
eukprot:1153540-Pelagomonas_calceolata.AAC.3